MSSSKHFTLSKKSPTLISTTTAPVILEDTLETTFSAFGNTIKVFSLRTGLCIKTIRRAVLETGLQDVHKSDIVGLNLLRNKVDKELRLISVCSKGVVAEWSVESHELQSVTQLELRDGKLKLCSLTKSYIVTF
jgi:hypothetical protein